MRRNLIMMDNIRHHCHVIQNICPIRAIAHTIQFSVDWKAGMNIML